MPNTLRSLIVLAGLFIVTVLPACGTTRSAAADPGGSEARTFDVVVYGATPGGVTAAVAAAREGASVALIEPLDLVGGIMSSGLSFSDSNQTDRRTLLGLFEEFHRRVEADYAARGIKLPYRVAVKDQSHWTYEPHVARRVFEAMLREAGVNVMLRSTLAGVEKRAARLTALRTSRGTVVHGRQFIDASYEGDLMARAGVAWKLGRESRDEHGESYAGARYPKPAIAVSPRDSHGKLLPLMTGEDLTPEGAGDRRVMVYSFRLCVSTDPANQVPFPKPAGYNPADYELVRRFLQKHPKTPRLMDFYPLPGGTKADVNNGIGLQLSIGLVGASSAWCEADEAGRARIWQAHKDHTLGLIHFLLTDPTVPQHIRQDMQRYGLAKDEFADHGHWPPVLYVREGRRMVGRYVMTQRDVLEDRKKHDAIAVSSFPIDSHDVQRLATADGGFINEGTIFPVRDPRTRRGEASEVPYRAITPKAQECENLLVPVALSSTHVALSSFRVEPTWMVIGQSAGVAAALAVRGGTSVQDVDYPALRDRLLAQNQVIKLID